jgi:septal ring factor EnvC (AmiA/AmiB activator)
VRVPLLIALLATQLPTLQQPSPTAPADGTSAPSELVQAAEAAKAQQATKERIASLTREAAVLKRQSASVLDELRRLDVERDLQRAREVQARQALAVLEADLITLTLQQARLRSTLDRERPAVAARLRRLQRLGRVGYARIAWNATSARDVGRAARLMNYLARDDGRRLEAYTRTAGELRDTETQLTERRGEARSLETEARVRRAAAEAAYVRKQELLASLDGESEQRERWLGELVAARARLDASMNDRAPVPTPTQVMRVPFTTRRRALPWPVEGIVTGRFGRQRDVRFGTSTLSNGVTIASSHGSAVRALHPGSVVFAGPFTGFGQLVIVDQGQQSY